jgi:non-heme chloroperoxidase
LLLHGEDDQIVPIAISAQKAVALLRHGTLKTYPGGSHGIAGTRADQMNADRLAFLRGRSA